MTEVRTTSRTGGQKGVKPERHDLMPRRALAAIARVFGFGATKYADHNWRRGYEWGKSIAALQRHVDAFVDGETYDEESGEPHLAHAGFHILVLLTWLEEQGEGVDNEFDDRWRSGMERMRRQAERDALETVVVHTNPATGTTSDIPSGHGDLSHEVDITLGQVRIRAIAGDDVGPDLLRKHRALGACATSGVQASLNLRD